MGRKQTDTPAEFRKSSYSGADNNCLECLVGNQAVAIRDSKAPSAGTLAVPYSSWLKFLDCVPSMHG
jgi:hypothetical protein